MCVFLSLLKYFDLEMLPHRGFCQSNSRSHSPPRTGCPKSAASLVADMAEVLGAGPPLFREEILREGAWAGGVTYKDRESLKRLKSD